MKVLILIAVITVVCGSVTFAQDAASRSGSKALVVFFSKTDNTKRVAEQIRSRVGGEIFHVATRKPYPQDYRETTQIARTELDNNERPELVAAISPEEMEKYDVIFFGYPIWWGTIPMAMFTFLEQHDLSGKTIVPFCTHEGSGLSRSRDDIEKLAPGAVVRQALAIRGGSASRAGNDIDNWLRQLGYIG